MRKWFLLLAVFVICACTTVPKPASMVMIPTQDNSTATNPLKRTRTSRNHAGVIISQTGLIATGTASPIPTLLAVTPTPLAELPTAKASTRKIKIMSLGGSVAFGWPDTSYGGFQHLLSTLLTNDGYNYEFVGSQQNGVGVISYPNNEGHPGWTITQIQNGIDSKGWLETYQPDIILLYIGSNDISQGNVASAPANLAALLDDILKRLPQTHIIVAQLISPKSGPDQGRQLYNTAIPGIVASKGTQVSMVDMQNVLTSGDYAPDGMHPNSGGYDKLARVWEPAIRATFDKQN
jgi:lysophospholipase L1-like esterase